MEPAQHGAAEDLSGGILGLVRLLREHGGAVERDLLHIGRHIDELGDTLSWRDLLVIVNHAQPESAIHKALNPKWIADPQAELLRSIELTNRIIIWQNTRDGRYGRNQPSPWRWPWEALEALRDAAFRGDSVSWEEAEERWGKDMRARLPQPDPDHDEHDAFPEEE